MRVAPGAGVVPGSAGRRGQRCRDRAARTMTPANRRFCARAFGTRPDRLDRCQPGPLVLLQEASQPIDLGPQAFDL